MSIDKLFEVLLYAVPSLITGGVAYYLFDSYFKDQQNTRRWLLQREIQKQSLPLWKTKRIELSTIGML